MRLVLIDLTASSSRREDAQERDNVYAGRGKLQALRRTVAAKVRGFIRMRWRWNDEVNRRWLRRSRRAYQDL